MGAGSGRDFSQTPARTRSHLPADRFAGQRYVTEKLFVTKSMPPLDDVIS